MLSKADEKREFGRIVGGLPEGSYLRSILDGISDGVCRAIDNDFTFVPFGEYMDEQRNRLAEIATLETRVAELKAQSQSWHRELLYVSQAMDATMEKADELGLACMGLRAFRHKQSGKL